MNQNKKKRFDAETKKRVFSPYLDQFLSQDDIEKTVAKIKIFMDQKNAQKEEYEQQKREKKAAEERPDQEYTETLVNKVKFVQPVPD